MRSGAGAADGAAAAAAASRRAGRRGRRLRRLAVGTGKALALALVLAWSLGPILLIAASSLKPERDIFAVPPTLLFRPTFEHWETLWVRWPGFFVALGDSALVTALAVALAVAASLPAGYAFSRYPRDRALGATAFSLVALRLIPPIVTTLPLFPAANALGLQDTHVLLALLYAAFFVSLGAFVMRAFVDRVPRELDESAAVDGAGRWGTLLRVVAPLAAPGMASVAVLVAVFAWNEFLFAFVFTSTRAKTAPLVLSEIVGGFDGVDWGPLFAAATAQLLPVLAFVWLTQRWLVAGLTAGATKG